MNRFLLTIFCFCSLMVSAQQGELDLTFGNNGHIVFDGGRGSFDFGTSMGVQGNGKIVVAGSISPPSDGYENHASVVRFNADGSHDLNFGNGGMYLFEEDPNLKWDVTTFYDMTVLPGGEIIAVGAYSYWEYLSATDSVSHRDVVVIKLKSDGTPSDNFGINGELVIRMADADNDHLARSVDYDAAGNIYIGGWYRINNGGDDSNFILKLLPNGDRDLSFGGGDGYVDWKVPTFNDNEVFGISVDSSGKIVATGRNWDGAYTPFISKFTAAGTKDLSFGNLGHLTPFFEGYFENLILEDDGSLYAVGHESGGNTTSATVYKYKANGSADTEFGNNGRLLVNEKDGNRFVAIIKNKKGDFVVSGLTGGVGLGGVSRPMSAMFTSNGELVNSWGDEGIKVEEITNPKAGVTSYSNDLAQLEDGSYILHARSDDFNQGGTHADYNLIKYTGFGSFEFEAEATNCTSSKDGSLTVTHVDGNGPYEYSMDGINFQDDPSFSNLNNGVYSLYVKNGDGEEFDVYWARVPAPDPLIVNYNAQGTQIVVFAEGGTAPYEYSIDGTNYQSSASFNNWDGDENNIFVKDSHGCVSGLTTDIEKLQMDNIQIYPNPVNNVLSINLEDSKFQEIQILDLNGRIIYQDRITNERNLTLDCSAWDSGIYLLRLKNNTHVLNKKVVKN